MTLEPRKFSASKSLFTVGLWSNELLSIKSAKCCLSNPKIECLEIGNILVIFYNIIIIQNFYKERYLPLFSPLSPIISLSPPSLRVHIPTSLLETHTKLVHNVSMSVHVADTFFSPSQMEREGNQYLSNIRVLLRT